MLHNSPPNSLKRSNTPPISNSKVIDFKKNTDELFKLISDKKKTDEIIRFIENNQTEIDFSTKKRFPKDKQTNTLLSFALEKNCDETVILTLLDQPGSLTDSKDDVSRLFDLISKDIKKYKQALKKILQQTTISTLNQTNLLQRLCNSTNCPTDELMDIIKFLKQDIDGFCFNHNYSRDGNPICILLNKSELTDNLKTLISTLKEYGVSLESKDYINHTTLLQSFVDKKKLDDTILRKITCLLELGANPHCRNKQNETPLHTALQKAPPSLDLVKLLLSKGANIFAEDNNKKTPLFLMLSLSSDPLFETHIDTLLPLALESHPDTTLNIIEHDIRHGNSKGLRFLSTTSSSEKRTYLQTLFTKLLAHNKPISLEMLTIFKDQGIDLNQKNTTHNSLLHIELAQIKPDLNRILFLLDSGLCITDTNIDGKSVLDLTENLDEIQLLLGNPKHLLHKAIEIGHIKTIKKLLSEGYKPAALGENQQSAIELAITIALQRHNSSDSLDTKELDVLLETIPIDTTLYTCCQNMVQKEHIQSNSVIHTKLTTFINTYKLFVEMSQTNPSKEKIEEVLTLGVDINRKNSQGLTAKGVALRNHHNSGIIGLIDDKGYAERVHDIHVLGHIFGKDIFKTGGYPTFFHTYLTNLLKQFQAQIPAVTEDQRFADFVNVFSTPITISRENLLDKEQLNAITTRLDKGHPVRIMTGYKGHHFEALVYKKEAGLYVTFIDRGNSIGQMSDVTSEKRYHHQNFKITSDATLEKILFYFNAIRDVSHDQANLRLSELLENKKLEPCTESPFNSEELKTKTFKSGTCSYSNQKTALRYLLHWYYQDDPNREKGKNMYKHITQALRFSIGDKKVSGLSLDRFIDTYKDTNPDTITEEEYRTLLKMLYTKIERYYKKYGLDISSISQK